MKLLNSEITVLLSNKRSSTMPLFHMCTTMNPWLTEVLLFSFVGGLIYILYVVVKVRLKIFYTIYRMIEVADIYV